MKKKQERAWNKGWSIGYDQGWDDAVDEAGKLAAKDFEAGWDAAMALMKSYEADQTEYDRAWEAFIREGGYYAVRPVHGVA